jgi:hypothetical protein
MAVAVSGCAVSVKEPVAKQLGTQAVIATPFESVMTPEVLVSVAKWHEGPAAGVVKSTRTPGTASYTITLHGQKESDLGFGL